MTSADEPGLTHSPTDRGTSTITVPSALSRRFEAVLIGWDGLLDSSPGPAMDRLRGLVERLCVAGMDVYVTGREAVVEMDRRLRARPPGPGRLTLWGNVGTEAFRVDQQGATLVRRHPVPDDPIQLDAGLGDETDSECWLFEELSGRGIGPGLVLAVGGDLATSTPARGQEPPLLRGGPDRCTVVSVTQEAPSWAIRLGGGLPSLLILLSDQLERRIRADVPDIDDDPAWTLTIDGVDPRLERVHESLLAIADGRLGTRCAPLLDHAATEPGVFGAGVYVGAGPETELALCPEWTSLPGQLSDPAKLRRRLDLRTGVVRHDGPVTAMALSSLARPGTVALRMRVDPMTPLPPGRSVSRAGLAAALIDLSRPGGLDRIGAFAPDEAGALAAATLARDRGFDRLLIEQREAWAGRWAEADVTIDGDADLQFAIRLALFHLMASVADAGEAAVGARGLSGPGYRGHVFWDSDVFVLPFLAATHPSAARAMLEYRIRRLDAARAIATHHGYRGARFPWESAANGLDVTPLEATLPTGELIAVITGELEEHIVADVAWAASCYLDWTGDRAFAAGPGRELLLDTARYWASRIRLDAEGRGHIDGVIGPDEYHGPVDDNAFTNVMARWNLRRAAGLDGAESAHWLDLADRLTDGFDPVTRRYEQFAGFFGLEPLLIADVAPRRPIAADLLLGRDRVEKTQVIKQADVLMLHHLVPDEVPADSLGVNLDFYEPRTAHGSSLSPAIHAALLARAGRPREAVAPLKIAARVDLDDLTGTTAGGVHLATMGGLWQAIVFGFAGVRPRGDVLVVDPRLPPEWNAMRLRLCFRGTPFTLHFDRRGATLDTDGPLALVRRGDLWEVRGT